MDKNLHGLYNLLMAPIHTSVMMEKYSKWVLTKKVILSKTVQPSGLTILINGNGLFNPILLQLMIIITIVGKLLMMIQLFLVNVLKMTNQKIGMCVRLILNLKRRH